VLADLRPGIYDEHGRALEVGRLDEVFGIQRDASQPSALEEQPIRSDDLHLEGLSLPVDRQVQLAGAAAWGSAGEIPAFLVHPYGQGQAILLNFAIEPYTALRKAGTELPLRLALEEVLSRAGIHPQVRLTTADGKPLQAVEAVRFRHGENEYVGIIKSHYWDVMGGGAVGKELTPSEAVVHLPRKAHVYDVRRKIYLGHADTIRATLHPARAELYALLPYRVAKVRVHGGQSRVGQALGYQVSVSAEQGRAGAHVVRVTVMDPTGKERAEYACSLLATNGKASGEILLALNDPPGPWKIVATDVVSGKSRTVRVSLKAARG
jgi:hypothetical protein